jgi:alpha-methylacyl-CoA racemase
MPSQHDRDGWAAARERVAAVFRTRTREQWRELLEGTDVCFAPVLSIAEAAEHPHVKSRATLLDIDGVRQPAPAPRFERSSTATPRIGSHVGADTRAVLAEAGIGGAEIDALLACGAAANEVA